MQSTEVGCRVARHISVAIAVFALLQDAAAAAREAPNDEAAAPSVPDQTVPSLPDVLRQLTDPGGLRSTLERAGLQLTFTYYGDAFGNPSGGVTQGLGYDGRFGTIGDEINIRLGQFSAAQEFLVSQNASLFVNSTFGWPVLPAQDLPSGGPAYPEATPAVRLTWTPTDQLTARAAIFNGDPAGPGTDNPVLRDPHGLAFRMNDPPLLIAELAYAYNQRRSTAQENPNQEGAGSRTPLRPIADVAAATSGLPGTVKLGA